MFKRLIFVFVLTINGYSNAEESSWNRMNNPSVVTSFYQSRNFQNVWTDPKLVQQPEQAIQEASIHGQEGWSLEKLAMEIENNKTQAIHLTKAGSDLYRLFHCLGRKALGRKAWFCAISE